jgi:hypothetical protein
MNSNRSLLEHRSSENRPSPQGGVEAIERHRGQQQNPGQTDSRIPRRPVGRQWKELETKHDEGCSYASQKTEADQQKHSQAVVALHPNRGF